MKRWQPALLPLLLVALVLACFRLDTQTLDTGASREALLNPWLVAGRLLEKQGVRVRFAPSYGGLPPHVDVLVLGTQLDYLNEEERQALLDWVKKGGHLVSELQDENDDAQSEPEELLAKQFDVRLLDTRLDDKALGQALRQPLPTQVDREGRLQATFNPRYHLLPGRPKAEWAVGDPYGLHALRFRLGEGRVTLLSDTEWMSRAHLANAHNGALWIRVVDARPGQRAWLVYDVERPSLWRTLWERAANLLLALTLFIAVWLWAASRRFGPLRPLPEAARRRLSEHLEASGRYLLRHDGLRLLHDASRQRLLTQVQRRHPQWRRLPPADLAKQLAQRAGLESAAVQRVLESDAPDHLLSFAADIRLLNRLRKAL